MSTDARGHTSIASGENPTRAALAAMLLSVKDPIPVANTTARATLITTLGALSPAIVASTSNPIYVFRADAAAGRELEYTVDGTNWTTVLAGDTGWTAPTLTSSWVDFGSGLRAAGYRRMHGDTVLRGAVKSGGTGSSNPIFTLGVGFRPLADEAFVCLSNVGVADMRVDTLGRVYVATFISGNNAIVSLAGIRFTADA